MMDPLPLLERPAPRRREAGPLAVFILNPAARGALSRGRLEAIIDLARMDRPFHAEIQLTQHAGHATALARQAEADGATYIFACGGDGTLNEVINGIQDPETRVGVIPAGTANVWAREAGIPRQPRAALAAQLAADGMAVDVGRAGDRRFLLMAGAGLDGQAVRTVHPAWKRRAGPLAYAWSGLRAALTYPGFDLRIRFDAAAPLAVRGTQMVIGNTRLYGAMAEVTAEASAVDGLLDCVIFTGTSLWARARIPFQVLRRRHLHAGNVIVRRARRITLENAAFPPLQLDGDAMVTPAREFSVEPGAVRLLVVTPERPLFRLPPA